MESRRPSQAGKFTISPSSGFGSLGSHESIRIERAASQGVVERVTVETPPSKGDTFIDQIGKRRIVSAQQTGPSFRLTVQSLFIVYAEGRLVDKKSTIFVGPGKIGSYREPGAKIASGEVMQALGGKRLSIVRVNNLPSGDVELFVEQLEAL